MSPVQLWKSTCELGCVQGVVRTMVILVALSLLAPHQAAAALMNVTLNATTKEMTFDNLTPNNLWVTVDIGFRVWAGQSCTPTSGWQENDPILIPPSPPQDKAFTADLDLTLPTGCNYTVVAKTRVLNAATDLNAAEVHQSYGTTASVPSGDKYAQAAVSGFIVSDLQIYNELDLGAVGPGNGCLGTAETHTALANRTVSTAAYRGVFAARYTCLSDGQVSNPASYCLDSNPCGVTEPGGDGRHRNYTGFDLPTACTSFNVNQDNAGGTAFLPRCCDCVDLAVQCAQYVVTEVKLPGDANYKKVDPPLWSGATMSADPELTTVTFDCDSFRVDKGPQAPVVTPGSCSRADADLDGQTNACDDLQPNLFSLAGGVTVTGQNPIPSRRPVQVSICGGGGPESCVTVGVTAVAAPPYPDFTFEAPPHLPGSHTFSIEYSTGDPATPPAPNNVAVYREYLHVSNTGEGTILQADAGEGDRIIDMNPPPDFTTFKHAVGFSPWGSTYTKVGAAGEADGRLFVVGVDSTGFSGKLYGFDPRTNTPIDLDANPANGITPLGLPGAARAVEAVDDRYLYILYDLSATESALERVDLAPLGEQPPSLPVQVALASSCGRAVDLRVAKVGGLTYAYIVYEDLGCEPSGLEGPAMHPRDEGGGGCNPDETRTVWLAALNVTPPLTTALSLGNVALSNQTISCDLPILSGAGLDFNAAGDRLFIVSPDENAVRVVNTTTLALEGGPIPVGTFPTDVEVEFVDGEERAYVANRDSDVISVIRAGNLTSLPALSLDSNGLADLEATAVAVTSDGTRLYAACSGSARVMPIHLSDGLPAPTIPTGNMPRRVIVQRIPQ